MAAGPKNAKAKKAKAAKDAKTGAREKRQREVFEEFGVAPAREPRMLTTDDLKVRRGDDNKVIPIEAVSIYLGFKFMIRPILWRDVEEFDLSVSAPDWPVEDQIKLLRGHVIEPDMSDLTIDDVRNEWDPWTLQELVATVVAYSGPLRPRDNDDGEGKDSGN